MITQPVQEEIDLENIKNQITLSEGELLRLKKLRDSEEYIISELVKEKKWHQEEIEKSIAKRDGLATELENMQSRVQEAKALISSMEDIKSHLELEHATLKTLKQEHISTISKAHTALDNREKQITVKESSHEKKINALDSRESAIALREQKIANFVAELQKGR